MQQRLNLASSLACFTNKLHKSLPKALGAALLGAAALAAAPAQAAPMRVSGHQLLDACGRVFVVRGVEQILGNQLPPGNDWLGLIEQVAATGANAVRVLPSVDTLTVSDVDAVLELVGEKGMVAFIDPLNGSNWLGRADVKAMLKKHESYLIIDAYGEPQYDNIEQWRAEAADALREVRAMGYLVPLTVTANQFGRDLPSILDNGDEILAADPLDNTFLGWQAYWGRTGYYQEHYGFSLTEAVDAIVESGLPIQMGLDHITDLPSEAADFAVLMQAAQDHGIGWLWWDFFNPYGAENNLSRDGSADRLTSTGNTVINSHAASIANTARSTCEGGVPAQPFVSINAGGAADGQFASDSGFTGGNLAPQQFVAIDRSRVPGPVPPESVYQTERWGASTYRIGGLSARSQHEVHLHFAEVYFNAAGQRKFNVAINGTRVLTNFDVFATAGAKNRAVVQTFQVNASASGEIVIAFSAGSADQPKISGIVIE